MVSASFVHSARARSGVSRSAFSPSRASLPHLARSWRMSAHPSRASLVSQGLRRFGQRRTGRRKWAEADRMTLMCHLCDRGARRFGQRQTGWRKWRAVCGRRTPPLGVGGCERSWAVTLLTRSLAPSTPPVPVAIRSCLWLLQTQVCRVVLRASLRGLWLWLRA